MEILGLTRIIIETEFQRIDSIIEWSGQETEPVNLKIVK